MDLLDVYEFYYKNKFITITKTSPIYYGLNVCVSFKMRSLKA